MSDATRKRIRVLFVDDHPLVVRALERVLAADADVVTANSAYEALKLLRSGLVPDAVICDIQLPGMLGTELFDVIRREFPALVERFAFISGSGVDAEGSVARSGRPFLAKPISCDELLKFIPLLASGQMTTNSSAERARAFAPVEDLKQSIAKGSS